MEKITSTQVDIIVGLHCYFNDCEAIALWLNTFNYGFKQFPVALFNTPKGSQMLLDYINGILDAEKEIMV